MPIYLLDTTTVSLLMRKDPRVQSRLTSMANTAEMFSSVVARGEVYYGLERMAAGRRRRELEADARATFARIPCKPVLDDTADIYAHLKREAERKGTPLADNDLWIAASAVSLGATLVTTDSDFRKVAGLKVTDWSV